MNEFDKDYDPAIAAKMEQVRQAEFERKATEPNPMTVRRGRWTENLKNLISALTFIADCNNITTMRIHARAAIGTLRSIECENNTHDECDAYLDARWEGVYCYCRCHCGAQAS